MSIVYAGLESASTSWPGVYIYRASQLEQDIAQCPVCQALDTKQQKETLRSHAVPTRPWQRVAVGLFHMEDAEYLVTLD